MDKIHHIGTVSEHDAFYHKENLHPLVSIMDFDGRIPEIYAKKMNFGFYAVYLKEVVCGDIIYGKNTYDYQDKTLVFVAPGQIINVKIDDKYKPKGHALLFHPDLIRGTALGKDIGKYSFFNYNTNEALHISPKERNIVLDCFGKIQFELEQGTDKHSKLLIVDNIELFLNYCSRFYDRQFITRNEENTDILQKFEAVLSDYFESDRPQTLGLPSVTYCAEMVHLSTNYFGDLIRKETGKTALEYIQLKVVNKAKQEILENKRTISEIAYGLGFKYPQHFTRVFKQKVGVSPNEFRNLN